MDNLTIIRTKQTLIIVICWATIIAWLYVIQIACLTWIMDVQSLVICRKHKLKLMSIPNQFCHPLEMDLSRLWMDRVAIVTLGQIELMVQRVSNNLGRFINNNTEEWERWMACTLHLISEINNPPISTAKISLTNKKQLKLDLEAHQHTKANLDHQVQPLLPSRYSKLSNTNKQVKIVLSIIKVSNLFSFFVTFFSFKDMIGAN